MQYRRFGKTDFMASALGFGCMRLPTIGGEAAQIDEPEAIRMIRHGIDNGVNYLDSAYLYHGGNSERVLGKALLDGYRHKVRIATKMPPHQVKEYSDFDRILNEQLGKLQTDHINFYLIHGLNRKVWDRVRDMDIIGWAEGAKRDGKIGYLGFSFHDDLEAFKYIIDGYEGWTFCQVQHNFMDENYQAGSEGVRYAASKGLAVVIMEPLLGGKLAIHPEPVQAVLDRAEVKRTPPEWALQWLWDKPEVSVVLSGMSSMQQVQENLASAERSTTNSLSAKDRDLLVAAREAYSAVYPIPCTECRYCMPCPNGVDIPTNFLLFNRGVGFGLMQQSRMRYSAFDSSILASSCIECRECETKCPQHITVGDWMPIVNDVLGNKADFDRSKAPAR